jgi:prepilin-type N-terminal cleavage/methylation domain-containing protein
MERACKHNINHQLGFTMIEIILVLIVMAITATFILTRATPGSNDLIAQTEILKSHLRYAQIRAMNDTVPSWGIYIRDAGFYVLYRNNAQATAQLPGEKDETDKNAQTHKLPTAVTVTFGVGATYNFNKWGTPVDTGDTPIASAQTITLSQGTTTSNITITKNTGYIP